jgi:hypothetical protein
MLLLALVYCVLTFSPKTRRKLKKTIAKDEEASVGTLPVESPPVTEN